MPDAVCAIRLLLVDDHPVVRAGLVAMLESDARLQVVGQAADGHEALAQYGTLQPDVTLLDLQMPGGIDGVETLTALRSRFTHARVIVLTTFGGDEDVYRAIRAGARAYLLKDASREQLIDCICEVHAGSTYLPTGVASKLASRVGEPDLSRREIDVLRLLAKGLSNKEMGTALFVAESTVKTHVKSILAKLGVASRTEAVTAAMQRGFLKH